MVRTATYKLIVIGGYAAQVLDNGSIKSPCQSSLDLVRHSAVLASRVSPRPCNLVLSPLLRPPLFLRKPCVQIPTCGVTSLCRRRFTGKIISARITISSNFCRPSPFNFCSWSFYFAFCESLPFINDGRP